MSIILASASPRRKELLEMLGIKDMKIIPAKGEEAAPEGVSPGGLVEILALQKAREVRQLCSEEDIVIAADTVVWHNERVYGKPRSQSEAEQMLESLSGDCHRVYTGLAIIRGERENVAHEESRVCFRALSREEIRAYIATGEPMDKAGAYGAQGIGALFVREIQGDFFNVMGLPLCRLGLMLKEQGVELL